MVVGGGADDSNRKGRGRGEKKFLKCITYD